MSRLTKDERVFVVQTYWATQNISEVRRVWQDEFYTNPPQRRTISNLIAKLDEEGSVVDRKRSGRPKSARTEENQVVKSNLTRINCYFVYCRRLVL